MKASVRIEQRRGRVACVEESFVLRFLFLEACPELVEGIKQKENTQYLTL